MLVLEQPTSAVAKPVISINRIDASFIFYLPRMISRTTSTNNNVLRFAEIVV